MKKKEIDKNAQTGRVRENRGKTMKYGERNILLLYILPYAQRVIMV